MANAVTTEHKIFEAAWEVITRRIFDRAQAATELVDRILRLEGDLRREGDDFWLGNVQLSKDREILPRISRSTGLGIALYAGNRRITVATVLDAGTIPEGGEFATASLADTVLRRNEIFRGYIEYGNRRHMVVGRPILARNSLGSAPLGIIEVFQDEQAFYDLLAMTARTSFEDQSIDLKKRADSMESIIQFIDNVARKLQLLALNGNIIAAQAGKQGGAFRVVCTELGTLADQAKSTTSQVRKLIQAMGLDNEGDDYSTFGRNSEEHASEEFVSPESGILNADVGHSRDKENLPSNAMADSNDDIRPQSVTKKII